MRRAINYLGRFLLTGGTLLLLFVLYQLWGTGFYEARQQARLTSDFEAKLADVRAAQRPVSGTTTTTTPLPPPPEGRPVGIIGIPKIGVERTIVQGITVPNLREGPGHYPESPMPGQIGNAAIAGHRTTYGAPFNRLDELAPGDEITIATLAGSYKYLVTETLIVTRADVYVLDPTPDATLTLTTCHPKFSARQRLVVKARLDVEHSPAPTKGKHSGGSRQHLAIDDLTGTPESRIPVIWSSLVVAAVGGLWWFAFHRRRRWFVWLAGAIPFLVAYAFFCFFLERILPPGF